MPNKKQTVNLGDRVVEVDSVEDVDLDREQVSVNGERLTEAGAAALAERIRGAGRGRPSIDQAAAGKGHRSPQVGFRVSQELKADLAQLAERDGVAESEVLRRALEEYVSRHKSA